MAQEQSEQAAARREKIFMMVDYIKTRNHVKQETTRPRNILDN